MVAPGSTVKYVFETEYADLEIFEIDDKTCQLHLSATEESISYSIDIPKTELSKLVMFLELIRMHAK